MTDYPYDAGEPRKWDRPDEDYPCPLCGRGGGSWEYGWRCTNDDCPAEELEGTPVITVRVDGDALREYIHENPEVKEMLESRRDYYRQKNP